MEASDQPAMDKDAIIEELQAEIVDMTDRTIVTLYRCQTARLRVLNEVLHGIKDGYMGDTSDERDSALDAVYKAITHIALESIDAD